MTQSTISPSRPRRRRVQVSLLTTLLLLTAFATTFAWYRTRLQVADVSRSLSAMQTLSRELTVDDETKIAAITRLPRSSNELIFDVYLPTTSDDRPGHHLCLALEQIVARRLPPPRHEFPTTEHRILLTPGRHKIEIVHQKPDHRDATPKHRVEILLDDSVVIQETRPDAWHDSGGSSSTGTIKQTRTFQSTDHVELYRERFSQKRLPGQLMAPDKEFANGILLWIAPAGE